MITVFGLTGDQPLMLLGLSTENINRLRDGQPIRYVVDQGGFTGQIVILHGDTEQRILEDLYAAGMVTAESPLLYRCGRCGATSAHPEDRKEGYCGRCHQFAGDTT